MISCYPLKRIYPEIKITLDMHLIPSIFFFFFMRSQLCCFKQQSSDILFCRGIFMDIKEKTFRYLQTTLTWLLILPMFDHG